MDFYIELPGFLHMFIQNSKYLGKYLKSRQNQVIAWNPCKTQVHMETHVTHGKKFQ
jgi:hypothetical protein